MEVADMQGAQANMLVRASPSGGGSGEIGGKYYSVIIRCYCSVPIGRTAGFAGVFLCFRIFSGR